MKEIGMKKSDLIFLTLVAIAAIVGAFWSEYRLGYYSIWALLAPMAIAMLWFLFDGLVISGLGGKILDFLSERCGECKAILDNPKVCGLEQAGDYLRQKVVCPACGSENVRILPLHTQLPAH